MDFEYAAEMTQWQPWQVEYRWGLVLIVPPEPHRERVNAIRRRYAWSQSSECDAHISLSLPVPRPVSHADLAELEAHLAGQAPFEVRYGPLVREPQHPGVVLAVEPQARLAELAATLDAAPLFATALDAAAPARRWPFWGHMTLAEMLNWEQTRAILAELDGTEPTGCFTVDHLVYLVPDEGFAFRQAAVVRLGR